MTFWKSVGAIIVAFSILTFAGAIIQGCFWLANGRSIYTAPATSTTYGPYVVTSIEAAGYRCKDAAGTEYLVQTPAGYGAEVGQSYKLQPVGNGYYYFIK